MGTEADNSNNQFIDGLGKIEPDPRDEQIQKLQDALSREKDARKEEHFVVIIFVIILLDIVFFIQMPSFGGPLAILILELLILIPLARRMGMEEIVRILDKVLSRVVNAIKD